MIYAQLSTAEDIDRIDEQLSKADKKNWYRRLMIIKASATQRLSVPQLAKMFGVCEPTVRKYIHIYNQSSLDALLPQSPPGCNGKVIHLTREDFDKILAQTPNEYGQLNTDSRQWTLKLIQLYLLEYHQIQVTLPTVYNALRRTGRRTGRSKLRVGSPDPDYQVKREVIEELKNFRSRGN